MRKIHKREKYQFQNIFRDSLDRFEERSLIFETFLDTESHVTEKELTALIKEKWDDPDEQLIHDTLKLMCDFGFAHQNRFEDGEIRYEHLHPGIHHDHIICTKCRKIQDFNDIDLEKMQQKIANSYGFQLLYHKMELYGICSQCIEKGSRSFPLNMSRQGQDLVIKGFIGGHKARGRLMSMGLLPGVKLTVITNLTQGQVVVSVNNNRYAVGYGLAQKIIVEAAS